ncbi:hypothetical protein HPB52_021025 [Rhipicephalus sanguineus]|uniref:Uncharacterized protein n=1 Tax=Rhipicephalus sanguineus TaxID=34632 RepID=A0A9D4T4D6_RHISA|nr:hypothetical protein HPB52_021025 [Rhipicephalus sanguineus]
MAALLANLPPFLNAAGGTGWEDKKRVSALISALGIEGQRKYFAAQEQLEAQADGTVTASSSGTVPKTEAATETEYDTVLRFLDGLFTETTNVLAERHLGSIQCVAAAQNGGSAASLAPHVTQHGGGFLPKLGSRTQDGCAGSTLNRSRAPSQERAKPHLYPFTLGHRRPSTKVESHVRWPHTGMCSKGRGCTTSECPFVQRQLCPDATASLRLRPRDASSTHIFKVAALATGPHSEGPLTLVTVLSRANTIATLWCYFQARRPRHCGAMLPVAPTWRRGKGGHSQRFLKTGADYTGTPPPAAKSPVSCGPPTPQPRDDLRLMDTSLPSALWWLTRPPRLGLQGVATSPAAGLRAVFPRVPTHSVTPYPFDVRRFLVDWITEGRNIFQHLCNISRDRCTWPPLGWITGGRHTLQFQRSRRWCLT